MKTFCLLVFLIPALILLSSAFGWKAAIGFWLLAIAYHNIEKD
jgi:hypothetical protein